MQEERFDLNQVNVSGRIYKIWSRSDGNIYMRIENENKERVTIALPNGQVNGEEVSLQSGDDIQVEGYLKDFAYQDALNHFFKSDGRVKSLKELPELQSLVHSGAGPQRYLMAVVPEKLTRIAPPAETQVRVEGIVFRKWSFGDNHCVRLLVFDENTPIDTIRDNGDIHRSPHSIVAIVPKEIYKQVQIRQRVRISGTFTERIYHEKLSKTLKIMKQDNVISQMPEGVMNFGVSIAQLYVEVKSMIAFTR